jgi:hypothetical protein
MKLIKIYLRYFPPGIALNFIKNGVEDTKYMDLFDLTTRFEIPTIK